MKYKHKITGDIAIMKSNNSSFYTYDGLDIHARIIENSNDWKQVIEKDYQILSFIHNGLYSMQKGIITNMNNGYSDYIYQKLPEAHYLNSKCWEIHSVRRISDGEVFTIGDKIIYKEDIGAAWDNDKRYCEIEEFSFYNDYIYINQHWMGVPTVRISDWVLRNNALFKTEDGVDIYEDDKYFATGLDKVLELTATKKKKGFYEEKSKNKYYKTFSSKEKAEEYILMTEPCISIKEFMKIVNYEQEDEFLTIQILKELVKSKLNG